MKRNGRRLSKERLMMWKINSPFFKMFSVEIWRSYKAVVLVQFPPSIAFCQVCGSQFGPITIENDIRAHQMMGSIRQDWTFNYFYFCTDQIKELR